MRVLAIAFVLLGASTAQAQNADPQLLALSCASCHGPGGRSPGAVPSLNGRTAASLADAMRAFSAGQRPATVMNRIAKGYSDAEIEALAQEIAANWK
jgi:sulfide dehydrogenase cytochrome subunit